MKIVVTLKDEDIKGLRSSLDKKLQVAAVKALEAAVERTPAASETPYSTGQLRQSLRVAKTGDLEYTIFCLRDYGVFLEFGTGPRGGRPCAGAFSFAGMTQKEPAPSSRALTRDFEEKLTFSLLSRAAEPDWHGALGAFGVPGFPFVSFRRAGSDPGRGRLFAFPFCRRGVFSLCLCRHGQTFL